MKVLTDKDGLIIKVAKDIRPKEESIDAEGHKPYYYKNDNGEEEVVIGFYDWKIYDLDLDVVLNKELSYAQANNLLNNNYYVEDGTVVVKGNESLHIVLDLKREMSSMLNTTMDLLYELSLQKLGVGGGTMLTQYEVYKLMLKLLTSTSKSKDELRKMCDTFYAAKRLSEDQYTTLMNKISDRI